MIRITSLTNSFILNGRQYQRGELTFSPASEDRISVSNFTAGLADIEIDGETFDTMEALQSALDEKVFKNGGSGTGEGVSMDQVEAAISRKVPDGGTNGQALKKDASLNNTWQADDNTTYNPISQANIESNTSTAVGLVTGLRVFQAYQSYNKGGIASFNGDDNTEMFTIPHGLGQVPRFHLCTRNADTGDSFTLFETMADETNITIRFQAPPMTGADIMINWFASK
jgi:hypothetical protein